MNERLNKRKFPYGDAPATKGKKRKYDNLTKTTIMLPDEVSMKLDEIIIKLRAKYPHIKQLRSLSKGQIIRASIKSIVPQLMDLLEKDHKDIDILKLLDL